MKAIVILSGGQDSSYCLFSALAEKYDTVYAITFDYGQRHRIELESAAAQVIIARHHYPKTMAEHRVVTIPSELLMSSSPLVSDTELETYDEGEVPGVGIEKTYVAQRNMLFITIAANWASVIDDGDGVDIYTGVCQTDSGGYPDCTDAFVGAAEAAVNQAALGFRGTIAIKAPLMWKTKAGTVVAAMDIPYLYGAWAFTHTGYAGEYPPVTEDHATVLRARGFAQAGVPDPLLVRAWQEGLIPYEKVPDLTSEFVMQLPEMMGDYRQLIKEETAKTAL